MGFPVGVVFDQSSVFYGLRPPVFSSSPPTLTANRRLSGFHPSGHVTIQPLVGDQTDGNLMQF